MQAPSPALPFAGFAPPHYPGLRVENRYGGAARELCVDVAGEPRRFSLPVTFTPFASAKPCSARCVFCSETLVTRDAGVLSASLRPGPDYARGLARALAALRPVPLGLSLSGLEATDDADWLERVLAEVAAHERAGGLFEEKVLYTNAAGLCDATEGRRLAPALARAALTRAEVSRHHDDEAQNQAIMRFRPGEAVRTSSAFASAIAALSREGIALRMVCVVQRGGVASLDDALRYLEWANDLGVRDVVFRAFSRLGDLYRPNRTHLAIESRRVDVRALLDRALPPGQPPRCGFEPIEQTLGYYFWNVRLVWRDHMLVTFEASDYELMKARHATDVIYKLVYHANGNLCADWDPQSRIVLAAAEG